MSNNMEVKQAQVHVVEGKPLTNEARAFVLQTKPLGLETETQLNQLMPYLVMEEYENGSTVFSQGETSSKVWIVYKGGVTLLINGRKATHFEVGRTVGEVGLMENSARRGSGQATGSTVLISLHRDLLLQDKALIRSDGNKETFPSSLAGTIFSFLGKRIASLISGVDYYRKMDVLIVQDGGCAPGYDTVTAFLTEFFELQHRQVFVARQGFKSLVQGKDEDFCSLVYSSALFSAITMVPRVIFAQPLRERRGAMFRTERYPEFKDEKLQQIAAKHIADRGVQTVVFIGGNGTFAGGRSMAKFLPPQTRLFFIPVTIDSDVGGTECIGQHTAVEIGAEAIRCFVADGDTHDRCYIIEMMGAEGGYHALFSCIGAGADLAVMPHSKLDFKKVAQAITRRKSTVIVVAEGYAREERQKIKSTDSASTYLYKQLLEHGGLDKARKVVCEPFTRAVRGAKPNNQDVVLSQTMAKHTVDMDKEKQSHRMPCVVSGKVSSLTFSDIKTDNTVDPYYVALADHLTTPTANCV